MGSNEVTVAEFRIGQHIALQGVWFKVEAVEGQRVTLEAVTVTAGSIKKQSRDWRKKNGKHWRRAARKQFARSVNDERKRMAAECRAWLAAEAEWLSQVGGEETRNPHELVVSDPALD